MHRMMPENSSFFFYLPFLLRAIPPDFCFAPADFPALPQKSSIQQLRSPMERPVDARFHRGSYCTRSICRIHFSKACLEQPNAALLLTNLVS